MISQILPGIFRLRIPVPGALKSMNCYLLQNNRGWSAVDAGPNLPGGREKWEIALKDLNIGFNDIKQIIITHSHIDHIGLAGWLQEMSDAPVLMSELEREVAQKYHNEEALNSLGFNEGMLRLGFKEEELDKLRNIVGSVTYIVQPWPEIQVLNDSSIRLGNRDWETILGAGHTDAHLSLFNRHDGILLSGDQILTTISTVIQYPNEYVVNPLGEYLQSLQMLSQLPVQMVLPAHGEPFPDLGARVRQLYQHHDRRIRFILDGLEDQPIGMRAIISKLFGPDLDLFNLFLAAGEVLGHLLLLIHRGIVGVSEDPESGQFTYYQQAGFQYNGNLFE